MSPVLEETVVMSHGVFMVDVDKRIRSCMKYGLATGNQYHRQQTVLLIFLFY